MIDNKIDYSILLVEDEDEIRNNYKRYLARHFNTIFIAVDGEEAYKVYKEEQPDIIIVDINLPKLNGIDLLKKIRKTDQVTKIIILTAHSDLKLLLEATALKLVKYLVKPISRKELKEALDLAIDEFMKFDVVPKELLQLREGYLWNYKTNTMLNTKGEVHLTNKEKIIITLLLSNTNLIFTYDDIIGRVWDDFSQDKLDSLKTIVKNIRKKLPKNSIINIFGIGYKF